MASRLRLLSLRRRVVLLIVLHIHRLHCHHPSCFLLSYVCKRLAEQGRTHCAISIASLLSLSCLTFLFCRVSFGSLDVYCWDAHSFLPISSNTQKKYSGWGSCLARNFGRHSSHHLRELFIIEQTKTENEPPHTPLPTTGYLALAVIRYHPTQQMSDS